MSPLPAPAAAGTAWHVALLRGVNVGTAKRVPMATLRTIAADIGFTDVMTLLNSGNVVYRSAGVAPSVAATLLRRAIATTLQVDTAVFVRTREELDAILAGNPLVAEAAVNPSRLLVTLCDETVTPAQRKAFADAARGGETWVAGEHALYLWLPDGLSASTGYEQAARALGDHITARTWSTMQKLRAMMPSEPGG